MKILNYTLVSLLAVSLLSCKKDGKMNESGKDSVIAKKDSVVVPEIYKEYYGIYMGDFAGKEMITAEDGEQYEDFVNKRLSLKINRITKDSVYGQSIVNGNQRPFRGIFNESTKSFVLDEPGNDKTDGRFEIKLSGDSITGKWNAFNKTAVKSPLKTIKLSKKNSFIIRILCWMKTQTLWTGLILKALLKNIKTKKQVKQKAILLRKTEPHLMQFLK